MSLPPGFLDELRSRISLSQVAARKVTWDTRKSNQAKGDLWAPCPFHQEKTASFHVDDRKGFYYCFGCHAKGDAITFVRETENLGFMEAVERLAQEVGMNMPARDPQAQAKADRHSLLAQVMEQAVQFYRLQLKTAAAEAARSYLAGRGLDAAIQEQFEIGFAPAGWQVLWDHLRNKGVEEDLILEAGLAKPSQKGGKPYDTFRGRIMFPIRDGRGRAIAFGARALSAEDSPKYLNSPETPLFDKSRSLYNHGPARTAAGKGAPLIVAEGYMDVIALSQAGFAASVAPLGTAITETQLQLLWRITPEPLIMLDGDTAGQRAAGRLIDLALPLLQAGQGLRFVQLPGGMDPDDLLRASGRGPMQTLVEQSLPLVDLLWARETADGNFDSPERKAALDKRLREVLQKIADADLRAHYSQAIKDLRWRFFRPKRSGGQPRKAWGARVPQAPMPSTKTSLLASGTEDGTEHLREAVILATCLATPQVIPEFETELESLICDTPIHAQLRDVILRALAQPDSLSAQVEAEIGPGALEKLAGARHVAVIPAVRHPGNLELARLTLREEWAKLVALRGLASEIEEASEDVGETESEAITWRLREAAEARTAALNGAQEDTEEFEVADNGALMKRDERSAFDALLEQITSRESKSDSQR